MTNSTSRTTCPCHRLARAVVAFLILLAFSPVVDGAACTMISCGEIECCQDVGNDAVGEAVCTELGGTYAGVRTNCADASPVQPLCNFTTQACCLTDGSCSDVVTSGSVCTQVGGTLQPIGLTCAEGACDPTGACCVPLADGGGGCTDGLTALDCAAWSGLYLGDDSSCVTGICDGACCFTLCPAYLISETRSLDTVPPCQVTDENNCLIQGGQFAGSQTDCDVCEPEPTGACCVSDSDGMAAPADPCMEALTEEGCAAWSGTWFGPDSVCEPGICNGACCFDTGSCTDDLSEADCEVNSGFGGGSFQGPGTTCADANCPQPTGACCVPESDGTGGCADSLTSEECAAWSGLWLGAGAVCVTGICDGACCLTGPVIGFSFDCVEAIDPEVPCFVTSESCCMYIGGKFLGAQSTCDECAELTGACCFPDGFCADDLTQQQCEGTPLLLGMGIFQGPGTSCDTIVCDVLIGACCTSAGCMNLTEGECQAIGDSFAGAGTLCDDLPDCDGDGLPDDCEDEPDCNGSGVPDDCELDDNDCNDDGVPDDCQLDPDCNDNAIPDDCELEDNDCNGNGIPDDCEPDCNENGIPDDCDTAPEPAAEPATGGKKPLPPTLAGAGAADDCADALHVCTGVTYEDTTDGATNDGGLSDCDGAIPLYDVWYRYRPAWSGPAIFSYLGTAMPMAVEVYDGCPDEGGLRVSCGATPVTEAKVIVQAKQVYWIRLGAIGAKTGPYVFEVIGPDYALNETDCNSNGIPDECECLADVNGDGVVSLIDLAMVTANLGATGGDADVDGSGTVDENDQFFVLDNLGECPLSIDAVGDDIPAPRRQGGANRLAPNALSR